MQAAQVTANLFPVELNVTELHRRFAAFIAIQLNPLKCTALAFICPSLLGLKREYDPNHRDGEEIQHSLFRVPKEPDPNVIPCEYWLNLHCL